MTSALVVDVNMAKCVDRPTKLSRTPPYYLDFGMHPSSTAVFLFQSVHCQYTNRNHAWLEVI